MRRLLLAVLMLLTVPAWGGISTVEMEVTGRGMSVSEAVNKALIEAIGQVHGKVIESDTQLLITEEVSDENDAASYYASEEYQSMVREQTKGAVSSYRILSSSEDVDGVWEVEVSASIATYKKAASAGRKRIAVLPMRMARSAYSVSGVQVDAQDIGRRFGDALVARLTQTRRFTILDREFADSVDSELGMANSSEVSVDEQARIGQKLVSDYVLTGHIEDVTYRTENRTMRLSGKTISSGQGHVQIGYRLIDVALQQVMFSDTLNLPVTDQSLNSRKHVTSSPNAIVSAMVDVAAEKISGSIIDQIYPLAIVSVSGKNVVIGQGGNSLAAGTRYNVYKRGKKLYDPYTKEYLGREESLCCVVHIDRVAPKQSYGHVLDEAADLDNEFKPGLYVLRDKVRQIARVSASEQKIKQIRAQKKKQKSNNDDW